MLVRVGPAWGRRGCCRSPSSLRSPLITVLNPFVTCAARPRARRRTIPRPGTRRGLTAAGSGSVAVLSGRLSAAPSSARSRSAAGSGAPRRRRSVIARRPALMPSQRSGSGSQRRLRWLTQGRVTRSLSAPVTRSASVRPARLVVATPSPTYPPAQPIPVPRSSPTDAAQSRAMPRQPPHWWVNSHVVQLREHLAQHACGGRRRPAASRRTTDGCATAKWYGAPRPPNASRPSAVRWP